MSKKLCLVRWESEQDLDLPYRVGLEIPEDLIDGLVSATGIGMEDTGSTEQRDLQMIDGGLE